jgi:DNA invertase Pin-like site-specific DNA recombinase
MGRFLLTQMAAVAELEAGLISERTKAALTVARERIATTGQRGHPDVKRLGNPNGARALRNKQVGNHEAVAVIKARAQQRAQNLRGIVADMKGVGITSIRAIAEELNRRTILTPRGGRQWHPTAVVRLLNRLAV